RDRLRSTLGQVARGLVLARLDPLPRVRGRQLADDLDRDGDQERDEDEQPDRARRPSLQRVLHRGAPIATRTGSVNVKVLPLPGSLSTQIRPPCSSTKRFANDRPSPVPSRERSDCRRACWNSSKIRTWSSGEIPIPVSFTVTTMSPSARAALTS